MLSALFSGLAFAGIVFTILLQRDELELQRKELRLTREEMQNQHVTARKQNFENTFFQMLRLHNEIVDSIDLSRTRRQGTITTSGRDCFVTFVDRLGASYKSRKKQLGNEHDERDVLVEAYEVFWRHHQTELGHYFRYLYTIFKFIKNSDVQDQRHYSNIVRAQLADQELVILFYNCIAENGAKFKPLVESFALFDNLSIAWLLDSSHKNYYSSGAYGE